ncbi:MAG: GxxExxY protein [Desulfuromonas sp.]
MPNYTHSDITERIIGSAYCVANELGIGFLEKVYENALVYEMQKAGLQFEQQASITVKYSGIVVGNYIADLLVEDEVIVELKAIKKLETSHFAQCMNYLRATNKNIALLINFGNPKVEIKRIINT